MARAMPLITFYGHGATPHKPIDNEVLTLCLRRNFDRFMMKVQGQLPRHLQTRSVF